MQSEAGPERLGVCFIATIIAQLAPHYIGLSTEGGLRLWPEALSNLRMQRLSFGVDRSARF